MTTLVVFGRDLRLADNPALAAAVTRGKPIVPVYIHDAADAGDWAPGGASRWWLHHSLSALSKAVEACGSRLVFRRGPGISEVMRLVDEVGAEAVYWNRRYEPWAIARGTRLKQKLAEAGVEAKSFNAGLIHEPATLRTKQGGPYRVFTPFWRALRDVGVSDVSAPRPLRVPAPSTFPVSDDLASWGLLPRRDWADAFPLNWTPGEEGAQHQLDRFLDGAVLGYADRRNTPGIAGTSRLSPHLHFGEVGPRQIWRAVQARGMAAGDLGLPRGADVFLSEIAWREFSYHLLFHMPALPEQPLRAAFNAFPWQNNPAHLRAWQRGCTGFPIVDAGMRELWRTGWMHNRVRMVVASFLIKDLRIHWRAGEDWFWDTLVDADLASNAASWQWVAGCGADAAPYFRIFNPVTQSQTHDSDGDYIRRWVPELEKLPPQMIHAPWKARPVDLAAADVVLGKTYPHPIVDHAVARKEALAAYRTLRSSE